MNGKCFINFPTSTSKILILMKNCFISKSVLVTRRIANQLQSSGIFPTPEIKIERHMGLERYASLLPGRIINHRHTNVNPLAQENRPAAIPFAIRGRKRTTVVIQSIALNINNCAHTQPATPTPTPPNQPLKKNTVPTKTPATYARKVPLTTVRRLTFSGPSP